MLGAACGQPQGRSRVVSGQVVNTGRTVAQQYHNDIAYYNWWAGLLVRVSPTSSSGLAATVVQVCGSRYTPLVGSSCVSKVYTQGKRTRPWSKPVLVFKPYLSNAVFIMKILFLNNQGGGVLNTLLSPSLRMRAEGWLTCDIFQYVHIWEPRKKDISHFRSN